MHFQQTRSHFHCVKTNAIPLSLSNFSYPTPLSQKETFTSKSPPQESLLPRPPSFRKLGSLVIFNFLQRKLEIFQSDSKAHKPPNSTFPQLLPVQLQETTNERIRVPTFSRPPDFLLPKLSPLDQPNNPTLEVVLPPIFSSTRNPVLDMKIDDSPKIFSSTISKILDTKKDPPKNTVSATLIPLNDSPKSNKKISSFRNPSKKELKPILKHPSFIEPPRVTVIENDPFRVNLLDICKEKAIPIKRSSSLLSEFETGALKKNPKINLIEFFKEKVAKTPQMESFLSSEINSIYSSESLANSPIRKKKKSATFSIVLHPSFNVQSIIDEAEKHKTAHGKKISQVLKDVPKAKHSLFLKPCDKVNQYILVKDQMSKLKKFSVKKLAFTEINRKFYVFSYFVFFIICFYEKKRIFTSWNKKSKIKTSHF